MTIPLARKVTAIAAAGLALLALSSCDSGSLPPSEPDPAEVSSASGHEITIEKIVGDEEPEDVAILCVDGSAFLYVYSDGGYGGGPAVSRFPEQDATCSPSASDGAETPEGN